jgi:hypothetical protein
MTLLAIDQSAITSSFLQYGILGIVALLLGYFAWGSYSRLLQRNDALERKVDALQDEMTALLVEERDRMAKIIEDNTRAINDLRTIVINSLLHSRSEN